MVVFEKVCDLEPQITWIYTKNKTLKVENFDMTDSYVCVRGYMNKIGSWVV